MDVALSYGTPSGVETGAGRARVRLSGARQRPRVRWRGAVKDPIALREALLALHEVVIADFRWRPPESRAEFERWLEGWLDLHAAAERGRLDRERRRALEYRWAELTGAQRWTLLDPVVSVHEDQVLFEAFSLDGGAYAKVGVDRAALEEPPGDDVVLGTTNVDFSAGFYEAVRRLRSIWRTELALGHDPAGEAVDMVTTGAAAHREKKVDLPDAWLRGFVQLGAASLLASADSALRVELLPVHVHDLCRHLRLHKARTSPRALRFELTPGQPASLVLEPWEHRLELHESTHTAREPRVVRVWGRNRLRLVERVLPLARRLTFHLLGRGLPYFVTARGDGLDFTLGLSGWTKADWSQSARFDALLARRRLGGPPSPKPLQWLEANHRGSPADVAAGAGVDLPTVHAGLVDAAARGLVVYDLLHGVYRHRPLLDRPLPPGASLGDDPEERASRDLVARGAAAVTGSRREPDGTTRVTGRVAQDEAHTFEPVVLLADDGSVSSAECGCFFAKQHGLKQGPCAHVRALLLIYEG